MICKSALRPSFNQFCVKNSLCGMWMVVTLLMKQLTPIIFAMCGIMRYFVLLPSINFNLSAIYFVLRMSAIGLVY